MNHQKRVRGHSNGPFLQEWEQIKTGRAAGSVHSASYVSACAQVCACVLGQAPWKQQQRSSAFKWIKTPAQSPGPAAIGQPGCSLDEDLRLIISRAAFVFAATVATTGTCSRASWSPRGPTSASPTSGRVRLHGPPRPGFWVNRPQDSVCHAHTSGDTSAPN